MPVKHNTRPKRIGAMEMSRRLLAAAGLEATIQAIGQVMESAPTTMAESERGPDPATSFCALCLNAALSAPLTDEQYAAFEPVWRYWLETYPAEYERKKRAG